MYQGLYDCFTLFCQMLTKSSPSLMYTFDHQPNDKTAQQKKSGGDQGEREETRTEWGSNQEKDDCVYQKCPLSDMERSRQRKKEKREKKIIQSWQTDHKSTTGQQSTSTIIYYCTSNLQCKSENLLFIDSRYYYMMTSIAEKQQKFSKTSQENYHRETHPSLFPESLPQH